VALDSAHLHCKDGSYRLVVTDCVLHVAAVAELAHRQDALAGPAPARTKPSTGRFDLPEDAIGPGRLSLLGTAGHRGASLAWQGAGGSTPNCLPLALRHTQAGDVAHLGTQLSVAAGTDLHWHQHNSCDPACCPQSSPCLPQHGPPLHPHAAPTPTQALSPTTPASLSMPPAPRPCTHLSSALLPAVVLVGAHIKLEGGWEIQGSLLKATEDRPGALGNVQLWERQQVRDHTSPHGQAPLQAPETCLQHTVTESQNCRGWKRPLWVI